MTKWWLNDWDTVYCLRYLTENQRIYFFSVSMWLDLQKVCPRLLSVISFHAKTVTSLQHIQTSSLPLIPILLHCLPISSWIQNIFLLITFTVLSLSNCLNSSSLTLCRSSGAGLLTIAGFTLPSVVVLSLCDTSIYHSERPFFIFLSWLSFFGT